MHPNKRNVTPEDAVRIFREHGAIITIEEAEKALDFLYNYGQWILEIIFKQRRQLDDKK